MPGTVVLLILAVWVGAIAVLAYLERADKFLWIPVLLAVAGVFSSILPFATSRNLAVITNGVILILFIVSLELLKTKRRISVPVLRRRSR